jgi:formylglycine-generating enzyme required for sulfatase activity
VNWDDAQAYVAWLSRKTGRCYRLPTEAEWEYAARAGTQTPSWRGASITSANANFNGRFGNAGDYRAKTVPVDEFEPNPWGLYQVHGNVWEWCQDLWATGYQGAPADGSARESVPATDRHWLLTALMQQKTPERVVRGGSWRSLATDMRSARRTGFPHNHRADSIGFRVACDL